MISIDKMRENRLKQFDYVFKEGRNKGCIINKDNICLRKEVGGVIENDMK